MYLSIDDTASGASASYVESTTKPISCEFRTTPAAALARPSRRAAPDRPVTASVRFPPTGASVDTNGGVLAVTIPVTFNVASFAGSMNVNGLAFDISGLNSGFVQTGTFKVQ